MIILYLTDSTQETCGNLLEWYMIQRLEISQEKKKKKKTRPKWADLPSSVLCNKIFKEFSAL